MKTFFFLTVLAVITSGCLSTHLVKDKARPHLEYRAESQRVEEVAGDPAYYAFLPLTVVGDVATSPFQIVYFMFTDDSHRGTASIHGFPIPLP